jgi:hypothetical protein
MGMNALVAAEKRLHRLLGQVEEWTVPRVRREDLATWGAVTRDDHLVKATSRLGPSRTSPMFLVGQLQPHPWPTLDGLRADGLAFRDSPGAGADDPIAVLHGGGRVEFHGEVHEGSAYHARREIVVVERKGRPENPFLRVTVLTHFTDDHGSLVAVYEEHILLREVQA